MNVMPLESSFGATVTGLMVTDLDDDQFQGLYDTWLRYSLIILPGQHLDNGKQMAFAKRFGTLEPKLELYEFSNVKKDGSLRTGAEDDMIKVLKGNMSWHQDSTYMPVQAKGAVFRADIAPLSGGETGWADMAAAYDALDDAMRRRVGERRERPTATGGARRTAPALRRAAERLGELRRVAAVDLLLYEIVVDLRRRRRAVVRGGTPSDARTDGQVNDSPCGATRAKRSANGMPRWSGQRRGGVRLGVDSRWLEHPAMATARVRRRRSRRSS